jgi:hypothetical protein
MAQTKDVFRRVADRTVIEITAVSALPMTYQWYLNGQPVAGATNNTLSITNLTAIQAGVYTVTASNQAGVATSAPIPVSIMPAYGSEPPGLAAAWADAGFELQLPGDNRTRTVLASSNLVDWSTQFVLPPSGLPQSLQDLAATNAPYRFYRVRTP